jgi:hypothetical protein
MKDDLFGDMENVHSIYHLFCDYMKRWYYYLRPKCELKNGKIIYGKRKFKDINLSKIVGYKAMCRIEKYANKNKEIKVLSCDDDMFMGSDIVLIPHESKNQFMGVTMLLVPQCETPSNVVFLYPHHLNDLIAELLEIQNRMNNKKDLI